MTSKNLNKHPVALLRTSLSVILSHPSILFPFCIVAFIQLFVLEIIFFAPRYPLSTFFEPIITRFHGEAFLHYPFNFMLVVKWFQKVQIPIHLVFTSFLGGCAVVIINAINNDKTITMKAVFRRAMSAYVHLVVAAGCSVGVMLGFTKLFSLVIKRAFIIRSTSGIYFMIKQVVLKGAPYFYLLFSVFVVVLFAFVVPIIIIEKKKIFAALVDNFRCLWKSFWFLYAVCLLPMILYVPVLMLKTNTQFLRAQFGPESLVVLLVAGNFVVLFIEAIHYTAITTYYLAKKEAT